MSKEKYTGPKVVDTDTFIQKARWAHGGRFDYSLTKYSGAEEKLLIICKEPGHGEFLTKPSNHINSKRGGGCSKCRYHSATSARTASKESFCARARETHGDKYDYSRGKYLKSHHKIEIVCPSHGSFWQTPASHINGCGCPKCKDEGTSKRFSKDTMWFVGKAKEVHGDKYDYSKSKYINSNTKVIIKCPEHGDFEQLPGGHLVGKGCQKCSGWSQTTEDIIRKFRETHGGLYDYSCVEYTTWETPVKIICENHGFFYQIASVHIKGHGCPTCGKNKSSESRKMDTEEFIRIARGVHSKKYNYKNSFYVGCKEKINIGCETHGSFWQTPSDHLSGRGCPQCAETERALRRTKSTEKFIADAKEVHGDKYDYSKSKYVKGSVELCIICPEHGEFWQKPSNHVTGRGCQECRLDNIGWGLSGFYGTSATSNLYVLKLNDSFVKVGLAKDLSFRMNTLNRSSGYSVEKLYSISGKANELFELEQKILRKSNLKRFYPEVSFGGQSECLELSELPKVLQIIEDWEKGEESFSETS